MFFHDGLRVPDVSRSKASGGKVQVACPEFRSREIAVSSLARFVSAFLLYAARNRASLFKSEHPLPTLPHSSERVVLVVCLLPIASSFRGELWKTNVWSWPYFNDVLAIPSSEPETVECGGSRSTMRQIVAPHRGTRSTARQ